MTTGPSFAERALGEIDQRRLRRYAVEPRGPRGPLSEILSEAVSRPIGAPSLAELASRASKIAVIISDASRDEPREELLDALMPELPRERVTLIVAAGTHEATAEVVPPRYRDLPVVVHDSTRLDRCVEVGTTRRGNRVRILREAAEADLIVVTGRIRPHYFAGYSGGVKGLFPGLGYKEDILKNHLLKAEPGARLGRVDDNPCRADLEETLGLISAKVTILNVLSDVDGAPRAAASGHPIAAHRALLEEARSLFVLRAPPSRVVVVADRPPVSRSLYQASKTLPPAGAILEEGGTVIVVAECDQGIEPRERVNEGIYRLGVSRALPAAHRILLVSALPEETVRRSYATFSPSLPAALAEAGVGEHETVPVIWRAGEAIVERA